MERKKFNRGTMVGGIVRIIVALIAIAIALTIVLSVVGQNDSDDGFGTVFMCLIGGVMIVASIGFIFNGVKMVIDGKKSFEVARKGHSAVGRVLDLTETEVTETNNGCVSHYTIYNLKFEYTDDFGSLSESEEQVSQKVYEQLQQTSLLPIVVYKERAIFDRKEFDEQHAL